MANVLIYLLRRDLRLQDNPILHALSEGTSNHSFTHVLPVYVFDAQQIETSGFISNPEVQSPYPQARSRVGGFWRCGPHRAKFLAESVWELKNSLDNIDSCLEIRVGTIGDVAKGFADGFKEHNGMKLGAIWMTEEEGVEEKATERDVRGICEAEGIEFQLWRDEKYFIDDRDIPLSSPKDLPDVFTTYRKMVEPLRDAPRKVVPAPTKSSLPPPPPFNQVPKQRAPFTIPESYQDLEQALIAPVSDLGIPNPPAYPLGAQSAHPFTGGESKASERLSHLLTSGSATTYKDTRNGLLGLDYSTKLSAWLALGCVTARQVHEALYAFEEGDKAAPGPWKGIGADANGYGLGESEGTKAIRFELLWRDYMRLCTRKFKHRLFRAEGFREKRDEPWKLPKNLMHGAGGAQSDELVHGIHRFLNGTTGTGLIDASQRELYLTGYMSNRSRQNVASFLARHLGVDWRVGAEWFECLLTDYDVSSNWGNWQYVAGVGNDPRDREGGGRVFNPVKQSYDYDPKGEYIKAWIPELRSLTIDDIEEEKMDGTSKSSSVPNNAAAEQAAEIFQPWTINEERRGDLGLNGLEWVEKPLKPIEFYLGKRSKGKGRHKIMTKKGGKATDGKAPRRYSTTTQRSNAGEGQDGQGKRISYKYRYYGRKRGGKAGVPAADGN